MDAPFFESEQLGSHVRPMKLMSKPVSPVELTKRQHSRSTGPADQEYHGLVPAAPALLRSNDLTTKGAVSRTFARASSGRVIVSILTLLVVGRIALGEWGRGDLVVFITLLVVAGPVEWLLHRHVLHASTESLTTRRLGLGLGHAKHHLDPPDLQWLLLRGIDAAAFLVVLAIVNAVWALPLAWIIGGEPFPSYLTALMLAAAALGHYEWTHLLVHTAYRPRSRYYARLARNHRRHHHRNERSWLGVTSNLGDRIMHTLPSSDAQVPQSPTARTLGG